MKKLFTLMILLSFVSLLNGQTTLDNFDNSHENVYEVSMEAPPSAMTLTTNTADKVEGTGALDVKAVIGAHHQWGSYAQLIYRTDSAVVMDWSISDTLSLWLKVRNAPAHPEYMVFRIHIADRPTEDADLEEYIYENASVIDYAGDWINLKVPLFVRDQPGADVPDSTGFILAPTSWGGFTYNNRTIDWNKIIGFNLGIITSGWDPVNNLPQDSITVSFDNFQRTGIRAIPAVIFNGMAIPGGYNSWAWGQSNLSVEIGAGATPNTNALKWVQGNEWGNGWTGMGFDIIPPFNLAGAWQQDSVKFKLKAEEGVGALRVQFEGGGGKVGTVFTPIADNQWHEYAFALREMVYQDNTSNFDSSQVNVVGMMAEASGVAGKVVYIDDWWTGNPEFDVIPPVAVQNLNAIAGEFRNLVTWSDVPGEEQETYSIYYSSEPITNLNAAEVVKLNIAEGTQIFEHLLRAPVTDQSVSYYYAITCTDKDGNISEVSATSSATTNTAKGVATVSLSAPTFNADGDLSEWSSIAPMRMYPSDGTGNVVTNTTITNDADLSVNAYVAMDNTYLYVAFDVEDDIVSHTHATSYLNDAPDLFIGLYNWHGKPHSSYQRGAQPDYHIRFAFDRASVEGLGGGDSILVPGENYFWGEKFPTGYVVEARIAFSEFSSRFGDELFTPIEGFRLPIDYSINDADATGEREGILTYSPFNEDQSWSTPSRWLHTWIGSLWNPATGIEGEENLPLKYNLSQNYPNPFNPSTEIRYTLEQAGNVSIKIYDVLGREVASLINQFQNEGSHSVRFDASGLSTGVYMYRIESGSFQSIKKMMLIK